jgi:hypothetical protein
MNFVAAILYAVSSSSLLAVLLAFIGGGLSPRIAGISLSFGLLIAGATLWCRRNEVRPTRGPGFWEWLAILSFALVSARMFLWMAFYDGDALKVISPNNLGDLSLHLTYINQLASGAAFWPDNPIYTGGKLTYPVGVDLFSSLLKLLGVDVLRGLICTGLVGCALTGIALWRWGRGFVLFGFLANGGLFGFALLFTGQLEDFQSVHAWKSFALALLATQRGLLFALPAGLALLCSWRTRWFAGDSDGWKLSRPGEWLLYASMPLFHLHTFLFFSLLLAGWFVLHPPARKQLLMFVGAALVPATVLVMLVTGMLKGSSVLGFKAGWMWDDDAFLKWCADVVGEPSRTYAAALFWPMNFGVLPMLVFILCVRLMRQRDAAWGRSVVFPALGAFLICCFVKFAPWEWDNTKIMVWSYLAILPFLWSHLIVRWPWWGRGLACFGLFFSGFVSTLGGIDATHRGYEIAKREELDNIATVVRNIPATERFVGAPTYNHPLLLCGRKMAMGYPGHVSSHGLAWQVPYEKIDALMRGAANWQQLAEELDCRYLFWGRYEQETYANSTEPWAETTKIVALGDWGAIYDLHTPAPKDEDEKSLSP